MLKALGWIVVIVIGIVVVLVAIPGDFGPDKKAEDIGGTGSNAGSDAETPRDLLPRELGCRRRKRANPNHAIGSKA